MRINEADMWAVFDHVQNGEYTALKRHALLLKLVVFFSFNCWNNIHHWWKFWRNKDMRHDPSPSSVFFIQDIGLNCLTCLLSVSMSTTGCDQLHVLNIINGLQFLLGNSATSCLDSATTVFRLQPLSTWSQLQAPGRAPAWETPWESVNTGPSLPSDHPRHR